MTLHGNSLIGFGQSQDGKGSFRATNPTTGEEMDPPFHHAAESEVDRATAMASAAFEEYEALPVTRRVVFLRAIGEQIMALGDELLERTEAETALPMARLQGERGRTVGQLTMFADLVEEGSWVDARIDRAQLDRQPIPKPDLRRMLIPIGPVAVFGASNFPLAFSVAGGDTASALAAGCPVIVKAHRAHPGTSELVAQAVVAAAQKTEMPEGVFSLLHGTGVEVGQRLVMEPRIKAVGFTGSFAGGRALFDAASSREEPIPVFAEMGSLNPVFILPDALSQRGEALAEGLVGSVTQGVGQFCTNPGMAIVLNSKEGNAFIERTGSLLQAAPVGTMVSRGIKESYDLGYSNERSVAMGIKLTAGQITSAAAVMVGVFSAFALGREVGLQQFGIGLGVSVLIDATVVRSVLLPATMKLLGDWNWYLPKWLDWLPKGGAGVERPETAPS